MSLHEAGVNIDMRSIEHSSVEVPELHVKEEEAQTENLHSLLISKLCDGVREVLNLFASTHKVREPYTIRVTEAISCLRKSYLNYIYGVHIDNLYMCIGRYMHNVVLQILQAHLKDIAEVSIEPKTVIDLFPESDDVRYRMWRLIAEPDMVIKLRDGHIHVIELKFQIAKTSLEDVLPRYRQQVGTYVKMLNAHEGHILIFRPDVSIYHEVITREQAEEMYRRTLERARKLAKHIIRKKPPEPEQGIDCRTCPYREQCAQNIV